MIPASFDYEVAGSIDDAIRLLGEGEDAKLLAGGHSLIPLMKLRFARPTLVIDIGRLRDLSYVADAGDSIAIGALTCHRDLATSEVLRRECAIVAYAAGKIGNPAIRHRGTIGGSIAHADPAANLGTVLLALDAILTIRGPDGDRTIRASEFFQGFLMTALGPQEMLTEIRVPKVGRTGGAFVNFNRRAQDLATVAVAVVTDHGSTRVALGNMGPTPIRASAVEEAVAAGAGLAAAAARAAEGTSPRSDTNGSADYRRHLAVALTQRALEMALAPAGPKG